MLRRAGHAPDDQFCLGIAHREYSHADFSISLLEVRRGHHRRNRKNLPAGKTEAGNSKLRVARRVNQSFGKRYESSASVAAINGASAAPNAVAKSTRFSAFGMSTENIARMNPADPMIPAHTLR